MHPRKLQLSCKRPIANVVPLIEFEPDFRQRPHVAKTKAFMQSNAWIVWQSDPCEQRMKTRVEIGRDEPIVNQFADSFALKSWTHVNTDFDCFGISAARLPGRRSGKPLYDGVFKRDVPGKTAVAERRTNFG